MKAILITSILAVSISTSQLLAQTKDPEAFVQSISDGIKSDDISMIMSHLYTKGSHQIQIDEAVWNWEWKLRDWAKGLNRSFASATYIPINDVPKKDSNFALRKFRQTAEGLVKNGRTYRWTTDKLAGVLRIEWNYSNLSYAPPSAGGFKPGQVGFKPEMKTRKDDHVVCVSPEGYLVLPVEMVEE